MLSGDEDAAFPFSLWLSRLSESFNCRPSEAWREWLIMPAGLLEEILEARAYERTYHAYKHAGTAAERQKLPPSKLLEWVSKIELAEAQAWLDAKRAKADG